MTSAVALVFPGQGSQRAGMLDRLPDAGGAAYLLDAAEELTALPLRVIAASGSGEQLSDTRVAQPLLYVADWAWGSALLEAGLEPTAVAGHSLGELAALAIAGVLTPEAGLELVVSRSRLMAECAAATPGGMLAVLGMDGPAVAGLLDGISGVWVANDNAPGQVVVSGSFGGLDAATQALSEGGARRLVPLAVSGPFHSPLMQPAADAFALLLDDAVFDDARMPIYQNTDPTPATSASEVRRRLASQIVSAVRWTETMHALADAGTTTLVEAGPGSVLSGLAHRVEPLRALNVEASGIAALLEEVAGS